MFKTKRLGGDERHTKIFCEIIFGDGCVQFIAPVFDIREVDSMLLQLVIWEDWKSLVSFRNVR